MDSVILDFEFVDVEGDDEGTHSTLSRGLILEELF
jgi:hypothetical protein